MHDIYDFNSTQVLPLKRGETCVLFSTWHYLAASAPAARGERTCSHRTQGIKKRLGSKMNACTLTGKNDVPGGLSLHSPRVTAMLQLSRLITIGVCQLKGIKRPPSAAARQALVMARWIWVSSSADGIQNNARVPHGAPVAQVGCRVFPNQHCLAAASGKQKWENLNRRRIIIW